MRCDCCPLADPEDGCLENEGKYGIQHKDGVWGCKHPRNWVDKRNTEYDEYLCDMGIDLDIIMTLTGGELYHAIEVCKHMIGLDYERPYHRHGKAFYRPYRNYYCDTQLGNRFLDKLPKDVITTERSKEFTWYCLTDCGLRWLGRQLKITIKQAEREVITKALNLAVRRQSNVRR